MRRCVLVLVLASMGVGGAQDFEPGKEVSFEFGDVANPLVVYLPENYSPDTKWPVVFHYHGTGGRPNVGIPRNYTGGRDFVLIGMEYATLDNEVAALKRDYLDIEIEYLRKVRAELGKRLAIDPRRSYVGGFSKGGWFGSEFADTYSADFAGAYVLGAGKYKPDRRPIRRIAANMPMYIGIGQLDINYIFSVQAIGHFKKQGAKVTYDEYLGLGHRVPDGRDKHPAELFQQWWIVQSKAGDPAKLRQQTAEWALRAQAHTSSIESPVERYLYLRRLRGAPFYAVADAAFRKRIEAQFAEVAAARDLRAELAAQGEYLKLVKAELAARGMEALMGIARRYHELYQRSPGMHFCQRAGMEAARLSVQINDLDRWKWTSPEARAKIAADLAKNPLPTVDNAALIEEFRRLQQLYDGGNTPAGAER